MAQRLLDDGIGAPTDQLMLELSNGLMQALGLTEVECRPDVNEFLISDGDQLLLSTDGLTDMVDERLIESILIEDGPAKSACRGLVDLALSSGGRDNVTVIVAKFSIPHS